MSLTDHTLSRSTPKAVVFGLLGDQLNPQERAFFQKHQPLGFILFARNCVNPEQIKALTKDLRACVAHKEVLILIDQEGGRVARLKPPLFRACPPARSFAELAEKKGIEAAIDATYANARLIAKELSALGINMDCAPVADLLIPGAHDIVGDRSYGETVEQVVALAKAMADGLSDGGVIPIMKHIPGHGRAMVDSHEALPVVSVEKDLLLKTDAAVFRALSKDIPWAMTAHIVYNALDKDRPATLSPSVIKMIREEIGFEGVLVSDDLSMRALQGSFAERTHASFTAGCDVVLHCNGVMAEMEEIAASTPLLTEKVYECIKQQIANQDRPKQDNTMLSEETLARALL